MLLDVGYVLNYVDLPYQSEKPMEFLAILALAEMAIWETRNKGLYEGANFSHRYLKLFFGTSLGSRLDTIENARTA